MPHKQRVDEYKINPYVNQDIINAIKSWKAELLDHQFNFKRDRGQESVRAVTIESLDKKRNFSD